MRTLPCCMVLFAMVIFCCVTGGTCSPTNLYRLFWFTRSKSPQCYYSGYKPGGGIPDIKPIQSPVAKAQKNMLSFIAGKLKATTYAGKELAYGAKIFLDVFTETVPKLASALGIFSAAFGLIALAKPSQSDLLKSVNKGFKKLTDDVNNRLAKMEGYVDGRVIELEKRLMNKEYKTLHRYWINCVHQINEEKSIDCMLHANRLIYAHLPHFQVLEDKFSSRSRVLPSYYDTKRLEVGLIPFREYAAFQIYALQVMVDSLKNTSYIYASFYRKKYTAVLAKEAMNHYRYSHWAYGVILRKQVEMNYYRAKHGFFNYDDKEEIWEGFGVGKHTADRQKFFPQCTADTKADINECHVNITIRVDGKRPSGYHARYFQTGSTKNYNKALTAFGKRSAKDICGAYLTELAKDIETYWHTELLKVAEGWKEVAMKAQEELKLLG